MGKVLYEKGEYDKSIDILEKVLNRYPLLIEALKYLTYSYVESNKKELAMQTIKRAVLLSPMSVPLLSLQIDLALKNEEYLVARDSIALMLDVNKCYPKDLKVGRRALAIRLLLRASPLSLPGDPQPTLVAGP